MDLDKVAYRFLRDAGVRVSQPYLRERLLAHPWYPAINAFTDLLDEFQLEHQVIQVEEKERWKELDFPFLAHSFLADGENFEIIKKNTITDEHAFFNRWTGITLVLGDQRKIVHAEHAKQLIQEKRSRIFLMSFLVIAAGAFISIQRINGNLYQSGYAVLTVTGLVLSVTLITYSLGITTQISDSFCTVSEKSCHQILQSRLGRLFGSIGLADLAGIYFTGLFLFQLFSWNLEASRSLPVLGIISLVAAALTVVSVCYQALKNTWCKMCLLLTCILWIQWLILMPWTPALSHIGLFVSDAGVLMPLFLSFLLSLVWVIFKPFVVTSIHFREQSIRVRKWRQDPAWFHALLPLHKRIDTRSWQREIRYGNPEGVLQILVVSDPYCPSCALAHRELNRLLQQHPDDIHVTLRFSLSAYNTANKNQQAVFHILAAYEQWIWSRDVISQTLSKSIIDDWFSAPELDTWQKSYPPAAKHNKDMIENLIRQHIDWSNAMHIHQTPAFFINSFEMPNPHTFQDVFRFASEYIEILKAEQKPEPVTGQERL